MYKMKVPLLFQVILVLDQISDKIVFGCPSYMYDMNTSCIEVYPSPITHRSQTHRSSSLCTRDGGNLAGFDGDFLNFLNTRQDNPLQLDIAKCYWINPRSASAVQTDISETSLTSLDWFLTYRSGVGCTTMCFDDQWTGAERPCEERSWYPYICEFDPSRFRKTTKTKPVEKVPVLKFKERPKTKFAIRDKYAVRVTGNALLDMRVSVITMCSRLCIRTTGCEVMNYNQNSKQCKGFTRSEGNSFVNDSQWDTWNIVWI